MIANGQAIPAHLTQDVNVNLYSISQLASIADAHFKTAQQFAYNYTGPNVVQLKVVSTLKYNGIDQPQQKVNYIDLTGKPLGQYVIILDLRKDIGSIATTDCQQFEVYESKQNVYIQSQLQTNVIAVGNGCSFSLKPPIY